MSDEDDEDHILDVTVPEFDRRDFSDDETPSLIFNEGAEWGAGWAFAIIGMAQAIADRYAMGEYSKGFNEGYSCGANNAGH
jgi:hypothetical protein